MNKRAKACDIPERVKKSVWERDGHRCIVCGSPNAMPNAHYIRRSRGGLGVEENIATLCTFAGKDCHRRFDSGTEEEQVWYECFIQAYLKSIYPGWNEEDLIYDKWGRTC